MARRKERSGFVLYFDDIAALAANLDDASVGKLILALSAYAKDGTEPQLADDALKMAFSLLRLKVDRDNEHYKAVSEAYAEAAQKREAERRQSSESSQSSRIATPGTGLGIGYGTGTGGGTGQGMPVDPRITEFERLKAKFAEEENEK